MKQNKPIETLRLLIKDDLMGYLIEVLWSTCEVESLRANSEHAHSNCSMDRFIESSEHCH